MKNLLKCSWHLYYFLLVFEMVTDTNVLLKWDFFDLMQWIAIIALSAVTDLQDSWV